MSSHLQCVCGAPLCKGAAQTSLCSPAEDCKISFLFLFSIPKSFMQLLSAIFFCWSLGLIPFCWFFYYHASRDLWCSSQALVDLGPPRMPYLEQAATHVIGEVHWDRIGHRQTTHWVKLSLLINEWSKMTIHRVQGENVFTCTCVTQGHLIEPFPAIPPPDISCKLPFFPRVPGPPDVPGYLYIRKAWHGCHRHNPCHCPTPWEAVSISFSIRNCLSWLF